MLSPDYLLKSQKNTLMEILVKAGLDPKDFSWKQTPSVNRSSLVPDPPLVSVLLYRDPQYYFVFDYLAERPYIVFSPGRTKKVEDAGRKFPLDIGKMFQYFRSWAIHLRSELDTPDYWDLLAQGRIHGFDISGLQLSNERMSGEESQAAKESIENLYKHITGEYTLTHQQQVMVEEKIQYLVESADRLGKKDWIHISLAVGLFIVSTLQSDPTQARTIWTFIRTAIQRASKLLIEKLA